PGCGTGRAAVLITATDVLIGQAYFLRFDPTLWEAQRPYAPLGALYAAACVRDGGHTVALFDAMLAESERDWEVALDRERPAVAVLFEDSFNYLSKMCLSRMREAALTMIAAAALRGIPVVVAGSDATDHPALYLDAGACVVIAGEGEVTLVRVIDALRQGTTPLAQIDGVVIREDGRLVRTPARPIMRDLDAVPWPAWDLVDVERYRAIWLRRHGVFSMNIATTRGCPYHCNWCAKPIYGQRYTARSPERVADEVAWLARTYTPDHLWVTDDIFGLKPGWVEAFARELGARDAVVPFKCLMRADGITEQSTAALVAAGCRTVWIGAESGSQRVLDAMEKGTRVDQIENAARWLRAAGIEVCFFLQFGYPGETLDEIEQTLAMVRRCRPHDIGISVSYPLPGTPFHARVRSQLGAKQNWVDSADLAMMYRATYTPAFYRLLHSYVHARFRLQRGAGVVRDILSSPHRVSRRALSILVSAVLLLMKLPWLSLRLRRLASERPEGTSPVLVPLLNRQSAALPSEQGH
ncbi:MAG: radical SAM protein, partial [Vicinamibacterales bacterium]